GDDAFCEWIAHAPAARFASDIVLDIDHAMQRIVDRVIAGAAAEIAFKHTRQIVPVFLAERGRGHDHAGGAKPALKRLRVEKRLLHRVQFAVFGETFDGRHLAAFGAKRRHQTSVKRLAVYMARAGAAIALVAAFLYAEPTMLAQIGAQTLPGRGCRRELLAVNRKVHFAASSARICSA